MIDEINYAPGDFACHEALHMASFLAAAVDEQLVEHGAIQNNPEWLRLACEAATALADLYQAIGQVHLFDPPTPQQEQ